MQARIDAVIAQYGGIQTAPNEVTWASEGTVLDLATTQPAATTAASKTRSAAAVEDVTPATVGSCGSGHHCVYSQPSYNGDKLEYSTCASSQSIAALGANVKSIANNRRSSTIKAYNGSTVVATVAANSGKNVTSTVTKIGCS